jgi:DNA-binding NarL/FixJ family response regulator
MIRILLADDHTLVRRGVRLILEQEPDLSVVAEAADGAEAVERVRDTEVDLVVLDIAMPRMTGLQAAAEIARRRTPPRILMLSMHDNEQYFFGALKAGASGYVLKSVADEDLVGACRAAMRGETFLYPGAESTLVRDYLDRLRRGERVPASVLIAEGRSSREIARELHIAPKTVEGHRANILGKLGMRDRVELTRYAIRAGLIEP